MLTERLKKTIKSFPDFPKKGILFKDLSPIMADSELFRDLINEICKDKVFVNSDAILSIDARGFIYGSAIAYKLKKPLILARKKNKLPGELISKNYGLEYGNDSLSIQKDIVKDCQSFVIVDDLLATGGTAKCVCDLLTSLKKQINGIYVIVELLALEGRKELEFPVYSSLSL